MKLTKNQIENLEAVLNDVELDKNESILAKDGFKVIKLFSTVRIEDKETYKEFAEDLINWLFNSVDLEYELVSYDDRGFEIEGV